MMNKKRRGLAAVITLLLLLPFHSTVSHAGLIDFRTSELELLTSFTKEIAGTGGLSGATATFSNARSETQITSSDASKNYFYLWSFGLALGSGAFGYSWEVVFDRSVALTQWQLGFFNGGSFSISGEGVNYTGQFPEYGSGGQAVMVKPEQAVIFLADEVYRFESPNRCCDGSDNSGGGVFSAWHVEEADVPSPGSLSLSLLALAALIAAVRGSTMVNRDARYDKKVCKRCILASPDVQAH